MEEITVDEREIIDGWRMVKLQRKGYLHVVLQSNGTEFYMEATPAKQGKVNYTNSAKENA
jgi:hypothetical protein